MTEKIDQVLQAAVTRGDVPGVVALAAGDDGVLYEGAARRAVDAGDPITPDTMLRIASMTKMVTTTAALQLAERGALELDAPVETYRPEFAALQVLEGFDGDTPVLRPPRASGAERRRQPRPHLKWGLGLLLNQTQQLGMRAAGSGAWAGLFNTHFWVDPTSRVTGSIFSQTLPFGEPAAFQLYSDFEQTLYAAL